MKGIRLTAERVAELNGLIGDALGVLYDGGYADIFVIHPAYQNVIEGFLTDAEKAMVQPIEELIWFRDEAVD